MSHPKLLTAFGRQARRWRADPSLTVKTIPLRYRRMDQPDGRTWRAEEKGIDVLLAVDVVRGAYMDEFDTAVVASADTDLVPALEEALRAGKRVETTSWAWPATGFTALRVAESALQVHGGIGFTWEADVHLYLKRAQLDGVSSATPATTGPASPLSCGTASPPEPASGPTPDAVSRVARRIHGCGQRAQLDGVTVPTRISWTVTPMGSVST